MHTTIEQSQGSVNVLSSKSMTVYVRLKFAAGIVRTYVNVRAIDWINNSLVLLLEDEEVHLGEVFTCEVM